MDTEAQVIDDDASSSSTRPVAEHRRRSVRRLVTSARRRTRDASSKRLRLRLKETLSVSTRSADMRRAPSNEVYCRRPLIPRWKSDG